VTVGLTADVTASLAEIGQHAARVSAAADRLERLARIAETQPVRRQLAASGPVVAATPLVLDLQTPSEGRRWAIRSLAVSDSALVTTAIAGTVVVDWYVGKPGAGNTLLPTSWVFHQATPPRIDTLTSDVVYVLPQDHLIAVVTGATTVGQLLYAKADVWDQETVSFSVVQDL
jgi:hypothetical protein